MKNFFRLRMLSVALVTFQLLSGGSVATLKAQPEPTFFDFTNYEQAIELFSGEEKISSALTAKLFKLAYGANWKNLEIEPRVSSVANGSFTEANAAETLVVVDHGWHGPGAGQLGSQMFILDRSGNVIVHDKEHPSVGDVLKVTDLDEDGLQEALISTYSDGMGYLNVSADLWTYTYDGFKIVHPFGEMLYSDCAAAGESGMHRATVKIHRMSYDLSTINWSINWSVEECPDPDF